MIKPVIEKRFNKIRSIYEYDGGMNPLNGYLESEGISYNKLKEFVENLANSTSKLFRERLVILSNKIFDRNQSIMMIFTILEIEFIKRSQMNLLK